jgi:tetratricopeptide (TPR) repeat protein
MPTSRSKGKSSPRAPAEAALLLVLIGLGACASGSAEVPYLPAAPDAVREAVALWRRGDRNGAMGLLAAEARSGRAGLLHFDLWTRIVETPEERRDVLQALHAARDRERELRALDVLGLRLQEDLVEREAALHALSASLGSQRGYATGALAEIAARRGNLALAWDRLQTAIHETREAPFLWWDLARTAMQLRRFGDARPPLQTYLSAMPGDALALYNLGWILLRHEGRPREALPYLERAAQACPGDAAIQLALGAGALSQAEPQVAVARTAMERAHALAPDDPDVHMNLGVLYADHLGLRAEAARHFRRYLELGGSGRERVQTWIDELEGSP